MSVNASYAPAGEPVEELIAEKYTVDGAFLACVAYGMPRQCLIVLRLKSILGILAAIYFQCMHLLLFRTGKRRANWFTTAYATVIFILGTVELASGLKILEYAFIDTRDYPGGPLASLDGLVIGTALPVVNIFTFYLTIWVADGYLVSEGGFSVA